MAPLDDAVEEFCRFVQSLGPDTAAPQPWGPKQVLAHLAFYHELYVAQIEVLLAGAPVDLPRGRYSDLNAAAVQRYRDVPVDEIVSRLEFANRRLGELCIAADPEQIVVPIKAGVRPYRLTKLIPAVTSHFRNHLRQLRKQVRLAGQPGNVVESPPSPLQNRADAMSTRTVARADLPGADSVAKPAWRQLLRTDPLSPLLAWDDPALSYFVRQDLLGESGAPVQMLWQLPEPVRLKKRQQADGSWRFPSRSHDSGVGTNYDLLETYRQLRVLVEMYGFDRSHPMLERAAKYVFFCQTEDGDIRGILGNQTMPYYHGAFLELLIKAGYADDRRVERGLAWLLSVRQDDGGWVVPAQLEAARQKTPEFWQGPTRLPDRSRPHAHLATGMALRAFAAHPAYRQRTDVLAAGRCLKARLFQADKYNDRQAPSFWLKFQFPFWWTSLLTVLDTLGWLGFERDDEHIAIGLDWLLNHQSPDGLWPTGYDFGSAAESHRHWVALAICRVLRRFFDAVSANP